LQAALTEIAKSISHDAMQTLFHLLAEDIGGGFDSPGGQEVVRLR
jgi:hypothetical protein